MAGLAREAGLGALIAPVRPNRKERYPTIPIERYARWVHDDGTPFDPWVRVHTGMGARLGPALPQSMHITGSAADWESWTGMRFPETGDYVFPAGLATVHIDREGRHRGLLGAQHLAHPHGPPWDGGVTGDDTAVRDQARASSGRPAWGRSAARRGRCSASLGRPREELPVPADYAQIRDENIARYGWDTAVLDLLGHLYSERTHFLYELIQNAEDAGATGLSFELSGGQLEVRHDGRPFTEADVRAICGVARSDKSGDLTKIGQFGIGFKAVYAYTRTPRIHSGGEHFRIDSYVRPAAVDPLDDAGPGTVFVFPFDHDSVPADVAAAEISAALAALDPGILLFLRNIARIRVGGAGLAGSVIERRTGPGAGARRQVTLAKDGRTEDWLVWSRPLDHLGHAGRQVEIAVQVRAGQVVAQPRSPLVVYFPTEKETSLGFLVQGPYPHNARPRQCARA